MTEFWQNLLAPVSAGSLLLGLLFWIVSITVAFKRIEEVERQIATPGKQLDMIRSVYRGGIAGRWMRALHVFGFFLFRKIPKYGPVISSRMGDEVVPVPRSLKLWATLPVGLAGLLLMTFLVTGSML
ncbi:MAG: hypothetical protein ACI9W6_002580 [Motiliproteus sp.]|jgi:hypothetical protein